VNVRSKSPIQRRRDKGAKKKPEMTSYDNRGYKTGKGAGKLWGQGKEKGVAAELPGPSEHTGLIERQHEETISAKRTDAEFKYKILLRQKNGGAANEGSDKRENGSS